MPTPDSLTARTFHHKTAAQITEIRLLPSASLTTNAQCCFFTLEVTELSAGGSVGVSEEVVT